MSFMSRIVRPRNDLALSDPKAWDSRLWNLAGTASVSGETVTEETALNYSAVWNAVTLIANTVAGLPLNLIQKRGKRTIIVDSHPVHRLLHAEPNEYMTAMTYRECMMSHLLLWGNCYSEIVRDDLGQVSALWPITPDRVTPKWEEERIVYEIKMERKPPVTLSRDRVLHIPGLGFDGLIGYSVVAMARKSLGLGMAMETFGSLYFGQGTHPGVVVTHPGKLSPEGHKSLEESLNKAHAGLGKSHRLLLLEESMKMEKVLVNPNDSQFLESRQFQIPEVARWFNLPPHKLKDLTRSSFNNIESEQISYMTDAIVPWLVRMEQNYNKQLLTPNEKRRLYTKHNAEGQFRGSSVQRAAFYRQMWNFGAMNTNEVRGKEDMDPIEGGDTYFVPANMIPLEKALQMADEMPAGPPQQPPQPPGDNENAENDSADEPSDLSGGDNGTPLWWRYWRAKTKQEIGGHEDA